MSASGHWLLHRNAITRKPCFCSCYRMYHLPASNSPGAVLCTMCSTADCVLSVIGSPTCRRQECRRKSSDVRIAANQSGWRRSGLPNRLKSVVSARNAIDPTTWAISCVRPTMLAQGPTPIYLSLVRNGWQRCCQWILLKDIWVSYLITTSHLKLWC
jgi:hypothetical protein